MARSLCILVSLVLAAAALLPCCPCHARRVLPSLDVKEEPVQHLSPVSQGREELLLEHPQPTETRALLDSTFDYNLPDTNKNPSVGAPLYFNLPAPEPPAAVVTWIHYP